MKGRGVEHAEEHRHPAILVRDDREVHLRLLCLVDVRDPALVVVSAVDAQTDDFGVARPPLVHKLGRGPELGGAHWREVRRVREEYAP